MKRNPRYYVKHELLMHQMIREAEKTYRREQALEKQREASRNSVTVEKRNRDRALSNTEIQFIRSKKGKIIHHITCEHIKEISDSNFNVFDGPITNTSKLCSSCKRLVWIALGIGDQRNRISIINAFFKYIRINNALLEVLFVTHKAQVRLLNNYQMQITLNGESWVLRRNIENHCKR